MSLPRQRGPQTATLGHFGRLLYVVLTYLESVGYLYYHHMNGTCIGKIPHNHPPGMKLKTRLWESSYPNAPPRGLFYRKIHAMSKLETERRGLISLACVESETGNRVDVVGYARESGSG